MLPTTRGTLWFRALLPCLGELLGISYEPLALVHGVAALTGLLARRRDGAIGGLAFVVIHLADSLVTVIPERVVARRDERVRAETALSARKPTTAGL